MLLFVVVLQLALAECCLKGLGYVTQSEHRTSKWLLARYYSTSGVLVPLVDSAMLHLLIELVGLLSCRYKDAQLSPRTQCAYDEPLLCAPCSRADEDS